jgi:hypothetical protein
MRWGSHMALEGSSIARRRRELEFSRPRVVRAASGKILVSDAERGSEV